MMDMRFKQKLMTAPRDVIFEVCLWLGLAVLAVICWLDCLRLVVHAP